MDNDVKQVIDITLKKGQSGYDAVEEYIVRYWHNIIYDTVILSIGISRDGTTYESLNEVASPVNSNEIEYLRDWWEGEKVIKIYGIRALADIAVTGGLYKE